MLLLAGALVTATAMTEPAPGMESPLKGIPEFESGKDSSLVYMSSFSSNDYGDVCDQAITCAASKKLPSRCQLRTTTTRQTTTKRAVKSGGAASQARGTGHDAAGEVVVVGGDATQAPGTGRAAAGVVADATLDRGAGLAAAGVVAGKPCPHTLDHVKLGLPVALLSDDGGSELCMHHVIVE